MECSNDNDQLLMDNDNTEAAVAVGSDGNTITPQHKLSDDNLEDILVNTKITDSPLPASSSFQERKVLFIEQARRFVTCV